MDALFSRRVALKAVVMTCIGSVLVIECSAFSLQRQIGGSSYSSIDSAERIRPSLPQHSHSCGPLQVSTMQGEETARRSPDDPFNPFLQQQQKKEADVTGLVKIASAALLITGNTVGAGVMVLPEVAAGPGLGVSTLLFVGVYLVNLLSGMLIAEVAIKQYETTGDQVPSSFKEFADANLHNPMIATAVSATSVFVNWCVMSFAIMKAANLINDHVDVVGLLNGVVGSSDGIEGASPTVVAAVGFVTALTALVVTQDAEKLSVIASMCVMVLFGSFASILLPGLASVPTDFITTMSLPGLSSGNAFDAVSTAAPVFLMTLVFQNIVPSVTKLLDYDRTRSISAIVAGSSLPLMMYVAWCYGVLGGGIDLNAMGFAASDAGSSATAVLLTAFTVAATCGSSIAGALCLVEELENFVSPQKKSDDTNSSQGRNGASLFSMLLAVVPPLIAGVWSGEGENFTQALSCAGSFGSPLLYGLVPAAMAWKQRNQMAEIRDGGSLREETMDVKDIVPGGTASLALLGLASAGFVGEEAVESLSGLM